MGNAQRDTVGHAASLGLLRPPYRLRLLAFCPPPWRWGGHQGRDTIPIVFTRLVQLIKSAGRGSVDDRISAHEGERLDREFQIETRHSREGRTADDEEIWNIPALAIAAAERAAR